MDKIKHTTINLPVRLHKQIKDHLTAKHDGYVYGTFTQFVRKALTEQLKRVKGNKDE